MNLTFPMPAAMVKCGTKWTIWTLAFAELQKDTMDADMQLAMEKFLAMVANT